MRGDPEPLLGEPEALQVFALADPADHRVGGHLDRVEADRRVAVRVAVGEAWFVDDLDPLGVGLDEEERRQALVALDQVRHHDQDRGDVAGGDEPLLAVEDVAGGGRLGCRGDPRRVRAGIALGHRVGVAKLAAQGGAEVALRLVGAGVSPDVVGVGNVPVDRVGAATELLGHQCPLLQRPALAAVLGGVEATGQFRIEGLSLDPLDRLVGEATVVCLGLLLERDQHLVGEPPGALLELRRRRVDQGARHRPARYHAVDYKVNKA